VVQAFLKEWWVESDFKAPNLSLSLRPNGSGCHYQEVFKYINDPDTKLKNQKNQINQASKQRKTKTKKSS
jgi:hypothetical protein